MANSASDITANTAINTVDTQALLASSDLSIWGLFFEADIIVKIVMLALIAASIWSWTIIIDKKRITARLSKRARKFEDSFWSGEPLSKLYERVRSSASDPMLAVFTAGMDEWNSGYSGALEGRSSDLRASLKQRIERVMFNTMSKEMNKLEKGMMFLATVGSTAPFVGLFGTVWGIMNSFAAIANTQNTNLAVVAPGIAEALFATALGLVAAIPAVVAYNKYSQDLSLYAERVENFTYDYLMVIARHLDQQNGNNTSSQGQDSQRKTSNMGR